LPKSATQHTIEALEGGQILDTPALSARRQNIGVASSIL